MGRCAICNAPDFYDGAINQYGDYVCVDCWAAGEGEIRGYRAEIASLAEGIVPTHYPASMQRDFLRACNHETEEGK